jgi:hypothetical protein
MNTIDSMHLSRGTTTSLEAPLNAAIRQSTRNNEISSCNLLNAFLHQVDAKENNGQLTSRQASDQQIYKMHSDALLHRRPIHPQLHTMDFNLQLLIE